ncbi:hypothetical protein KEM52_003412 [Ascosphaera acerosa]|nr:hypothetical protein KEM52_003412 [Ascosphaera acerosa]
MAEELTPVQRGDIMGAYKFGVPKYQIAKRLGHPRSTVFTTIRKAALRGPTMASCPRTGCPSTFTDCTKRLIPKVLTIDPKLKMQRLLSSFTFAITNEPLVMSAQWKWEQVKARGWRWRYLHEKRDKEMIEAYPKSKGKTIMI